MLALPMWCMQMLRARPRTDPVFRAPMGGWRDPSNTQADLREAFAHAGFGWITSHTFRKTVATLMDEAGLSPGRQLTSSATPTRRLPRMCISGGASRVPEPPQCWSPWLVV
jgi:integrase